ncbi:ly6/PLAUR domain-containing protein 2-like [Pleurodeles waltl]|uniref:ly6/PLAUR domain-containing protein 2-like n=1 Tax=Pleurodeles waltl TaxID=8319 RepID=UPI003709765F
MRVLQYVEECIYKTAIHFQFFIHSLKHLLKMKPFLFSLLAVIMCMELVSSLQCYSCLVRTPISKCIEVKNCSEQSTMCKTTMYSPDSGYPFTGQPSVISDCVDECKPSQAVQIGLRYPVSCCTEDLCNHKAFFKSNGVPSVKVSHALLSVSAVTLSAFLR